MAAYTEGNAGILDRAAARVAEAQSLLAKVREPTILIQVDCDQAESQLAFKRGDAPRAEKILRNAILKLERSGKHIVPHKYR